jgi:rhodanese-related sulfurtransferase
MNKKITILLTCLLIICIIFPGFSIAEKMWPSATDELVLAAKKSIKLIDMPHFGETVNSGAFDLIIDVREPNEFATGYVPGAINIPRGVLEFKIWKKVGFPDKTDMNKNIFVYCKTGGRASLSAKSLQELGFTNVTAVNMKVADWVSAGYFMEK